MIESKLQLDEHAWSRYVVGGARDAFVGLPHEGTRDKRTEVDEFLRGVGRIVRFSLEVSVVEVLLFESVVDVDEYEDVRKMGLALEDEEEGG